MAETPTDAIRVGDATGQGKTLSALLTAHGSLMCMSYVAWNDICTAAGVPPFSAPDTVTVAILRLQEAGGGDQAV